MRFILRFVLLWILFQGLFFDNVSGHTLENKIYGSRDTCKCNYSCWPVIKDSINGLDEQQILAFLETLGHDCDNNVEFSEISNEILFKIIEFNPAGFILVIKNYQTDIEFDKIVEMIENPINDGIDLEKIYQSVNNVHDDSKSKKMIIESLETAINKLK